MKIIRIYTKNNEYTTYLARTKKTAWKIVKPAEALLAIASGQCRELIISNQSVSAPDRLIHVCTMPLGCKVYQSLPIDDEK